VRLLPTPVVAASIFVALSATQSSCAREPTVPDVLDIATSTTLQASGLLEDLLPVYERERNVTVRLHAAGSVQALEMLADGVVQLVISHAPEAEQRALKQPQDWVRRELAHTWLVIVGPPEDPARVRAATDARDAFRRIASSGVLFVSREDQSGVNEREEGMWELAGVRPAPEHTVVSARGMARALQRANELRAYTLATEATFRQLESSLTLALLYDEDPRLLATYSVLFPWRETAATRFASWLVEGAGRQRIIAFEIQGRRYFDVSAR
jgi:tungstate transport system substrate-binding protein